MRPRSPPAREIGNACRGRRRQAFSTGGGRLAQTQEEGRLGRHLALRGLHAAALMVTSRVWVRPGLTLIHTAHSRSTD